MIDTIELENFKSFGERTVLRLGLLNVLVGPNNSGKSCFLSLFRFVGNCLLAGGQEGVRTEGGKEYLFHRPPSGDGVMKIAWSSALGGYSTSIVNRPEGACLLEESLDPARVEGWRIKAGPDGRASLGGGKQYHEPMAALRYFLSGDRAEVQAPVVDPVRNARLINLRVEALRKDSMVQKEPKISESGEGLASLIGYWSGAEPERKRELDDFIHECLPEVKDLLIKPADEPGHQRLWVRQANGESFDAGHVSDGVLFFIGVATHVISAGPGSVLLVEEPESSIHPRRIHSLVELMRRMVHDRECQIIMTSHSRVLLDDFRDEPESILIFGRADSGTMVTPLSEREDLVDQLHNAPPGDMIESGFFEEPFDP